MLFNLGGGFKVIKKVGYHFLSPQPNGRFMHLLVWIHNDEHIRVTFDFKCHRRLMPQHIMDFSVEVVEVGCPSVPRANEPSGLPFAATPFRFGSSFGGLHDDEYISNTPAGRRLRYILLALYPIPSLVDVPCFFHQLDLDAMHMDDLLKAELADDYNTDGGAEFHVDIG
ncbi:hypothetical protein PIB30_080967 [Stylosanthes scabra]|uniref:Uncharacterized protein n=1 Tax=Stylosanthes scabra TaxID=79078 RepID=A0ABU6STK7_9FABA|nr:hypothetical protein [Stylosanthes scabra]